MHIAIAMHMEHIIISLRKVFCIQTPVLSFDGVIICRAELFVNEKTIFHACL